MDIKRLCLNLVRSNSERKVISILEEAGLWDDLDHWRDYGDTENNFATIGNQQSEPEAALVEKLVNSVDAVLMRECLEGGVDPEGLDAPQSIAEAQAEFFGIRDGKLSNVTATERTSLAENISLVATGQKTTPSYSIIDRGEGQTPDSLPDTFLSLAKSNKLRIPFVQGKFNMGGTGVLQFCGEQNLQLIVSRRNPALLAEKSAERDHHWGFTLVRRVNPMGSLRSSSYKYLAPEGEILSFAADKLPLLPGAYPNALEESLRSGSLIKLYEYQMSAGLRTNVVFDLYNRISLMLPTVALPIRMYERRKGYRGHSLETTLAGLSVRLEEDSRDNLEDGFPTSIQFRVAGQAMRASVFAFKKGRDEKYKKTEGIIFTINGQTHAQIDRRFFARKAVGMSYLKKSILVIVDCSELGGREREDLFMNSRDRLRAGALKSEIEAVLERELRNHPGLRKLREERRRQAVEEQLGDSRPLAEVLEDILSKSPSLSKLFIEGVRLPNPFKPKSVDPADEFVGERFPSYFQLENGAASGEKHAPINRRFRVSFSTDAVNDYFDRDAEPGDFSLTVDGDQTSGYSLNLWNGTATLNVTLPEGANVDDVLHYRAEVADNSRPNPFANSWTVRVCPAAKKSPGGRGRRKKPPGSKGNGKSSKEDLLSLPKVVEVRETEWPEHDFDRESALSVVDVGETGYDFFVNMDNVYLRTEQKSKKTDSNLLGARFKYALVLIGLAMLNGESQMSDNGKAPQQDTGDDHLPVTERIGAVGRAIAPVLLPMIDSLADLEDIED